ncbi:MBL fold metallo-hydrolase [Desulfatibacillum aliphaticivorans]|uniref:MBL fold metallo-hydrolase n=1 Tax=Desulfatibacillum aliphaticivorans TaxID=218208 RepID=UPI0003FA69CB|nr:MBL fold metallo-hydrolase [Desulfatibacillum aliphaticivorans]
MIIRQVLGGSMGVFCYVIQDPVTKNCALIDPAFDASTILGQVDEMGGKVTHVINTHGHFDHICGNAGIISATGARLYIHNKDAKMLTSLFGAVACRMMGGRKSPPADVLLEDGDRISIGETQLEVMHTPGHSPGGICLLGEGRLFSGDTLFAGSIGATWFPGASLKVLVKSIKERLYVLPEETVVLPGHDYGPEPTTTIGREKASNPFTR